MTTHNKVSGSQAAIWLLALGCAMQTAAGGTIYTVIDLGPSVHAAALNDNGQSAGWRLLNDGSLRAVSSAGVADPAMAPDAWGSRAEGINNSGMVAGTTYTSSGAQATLWTAGAATNLGTLGGSDAWALSVNDHGQIAGGSLTATGEMRAFLFSDGTMTSLGALSGGDWSAAYSVNNLSQAAGTSSTGNGWFRAFVTDPKQGLVDLGTLGGESSYGAAINNNGQVVGQSQLTSMYLQAFFWDPLSGIHGLGTLGGAASYAYGINDAGHAVGASSLRNSLNTHAFLYRDGFLYDLNELIGNASGWELLEAVDINNQGQIIGMGWYEGSEHSFLLQPGGRSALEEGTIHNPEPATLLLLATGLGFLMWKKRKASRWQTCLGGNKPAGGSAD